MIDIALQHQLDTQCGVLYIEFSAQSYHFSDTVCCVAVVWLVLGVDI